jgi:hypothetical protein
MDLPQAQSESLITRWVDGELVVIDEATHAVHCLPDQTARVFMQCTGRQTPERIAALEDLDLAQVTEVLEALGEAGLLLTEPSKLDLTRRAFASRTARTAVIAAGAAPLITSLLLPAAAHASGTASTCGGTCSSYSATYAGASEAATYTCAHDEGAAGCGFQATCVVSYRSSQDGPAGFPYYVRGHCAS